MSSIIGSIKATKTELARRAARADRFTTQANQGDTKFAPPTKAVAHPDGTARVLGDVRASLVAAVSARLASGEDLTDAQRAAIAKHGVRESEFSTARAGSKRRRSQSATASAGVAGGMSTTGAADDTKRLRSLETQARAIAVLAARPTRDLTPEQIATLSSSSDVDAAITALRARGAV